MVPPITRNGTFNRTSWLRVKVTPRTQDRGGNAALRCRVHLEPRAERWPDPAEQSASAADHLGHRRPSRTVQDPDPAATQEGR